MPMSGTVSSTQTGDTRLRRNALSLSQIVATTLAGIAPAMSFFFGFAVIARGAGIAAPLTIFTAMIVILFLTNTIAQFSRFTPSTGSFVTFTGKAFGPSIESADEEAIDLLESVKDRIFVGPAIGIIYCTLHEGEKFGFYRDSEVGRKMQRTIDTTAAVYTELRKRGVRVLIGGDYGFAQSPQGDNARGLQHFVNLLGFTPGEALQCGTRFGGQVMGMGDELGQIKEGFIADLLPIDGDPLKDLDLVVHEKNLHVIMKEGSLHKDISAAGTRESTIAAD